MTEPYADAFAATTGDIEAPDEDVREQRASISSDDDEPAPGEIPLEADPADAADQGHLVESDDDEYR